jgi:hypothetical protein
MGDLFGPDLRNSIFAHVVHTLLLGGVVVFAWQTVTALVRKPTRVGRALRKAVYAAWLTVLFQLTTQPNPMPYLRVAGAIVVVLLGLKLWDRFTASGKREEMLTSGPARVFGREEERSPEAVGIRRD